MKISMIELSLFFTAFCCFLILFNLRINYGMFKVGFAILLIGCFHELISNIYKLFKQG